jgi:prophage DNA circulation protein
MSVMARVSRVRETVSSRGEFAYTTEFVVVGTQPVNEARPVAGAAMQKAAASIEEAASEDFAASVVTAGPISLLEKTIAGVERALSAVAGISNQFETLNTAAAQILTLQSKLTTLVLSPSTLALQLASALHTVADSYFNPLDALRSQFDILENLGRAPRVTSDTSAAGLQALANDAALSVFMRSVVIADAARLVAGTSERTQLDGVQFEVKADADAARDRLLDALDELKADAPFALFADIRALQAAVMADFRLMRPRAVVDTIELNTEMPAVLLAQQLYGDATLADDIVTRNRLSPPMFLPTGGALEVQRG